MKNDCQYSVNHYGISMIINFVQIQTFRDVLIIFTATNFKQTDISTIKK
jgi:hypothetical protein